MMGASFPFNESRRRENLAAPGLERPTALIVPDSRPTTVGSGYPLLGFRPMDLETAPPAPASIAERRDSTDSPATPDARSVGFANLRPTSPTERSISLKLVLVATPQAILEYHDIAKVIRFRSKTSIMQTFRERVLASSRERGSRVVLALDVSGPFGQRVARAMKVLQQTKESIAAVKVNFHLLLPFGLTGIRNLIDLCKGEGLPLIADMKLNDIGSTNLEVIESLLASRFDAVIANPLVGYRDGMGEVIERAHELGGGVILLVYMSHRGVNEGYTLRLDGGRRLYQAFAERARRWGADGTIVSARSRAALRETRKIVGGDCLIFAPGVGAQGGEAEAAMASGADFIIVGRSVIDSGEPSREAERLRRATRKPSK